MRALQILALTACAAGNLLAQHSYTATDIEEGGRRFRANCVSCHGPEGDQIPGVDLGRGKFVRATSEDGLIKIIQSGIPGTAMPPNNFSDFEAGTVVAFLRAMATAGPTASANGDAARGQKIFEGKGGCTGCHRVRGVGSRVGPDLGEIGSRRRAVELEKSILDPGAEVLPQNRYYRVVTKNGETVTGRILNTDTFTVQILDSRERLLLFEKAGLRESGFVDGSPMPSYKGKLSQQELDDVVAYLVSLKGL